MLPATRTLKRVQAATLVMAAAGLAGCATADSPRTAGPAPATAPSAALVSAAGKACPSADCCTAETVAAAELAIAAAEAAPTTGPATRPSTGPAVAAAAPTTRPADAADKWKDLFDGKTLANWKPSGFAGQGEPEVKDGQIVIPLGEGLSGVTYTGEGLPKVNFEIEVEARRTEGHDFFCGLTVPVKDAHVSLIVGGWGGAVVGLSCINDEDAAHNDTTQYLKFTTGRYYRVRLRVLPEKIQAWVDDKKVIDAVTKGKKVDIRTGTEEARPLGLSTWQTTAEIKSVKMRAVSVEGQ